MVRSNLPMLKRWPVAPARARGTFPAVRPPSVPSYFMPNRLPDRLAASDNGQAASPRPGALATLTESMTVRAPSHLTGEALRLCAIDVGSNSIHMIVAQIDPDGGVTTLWRMKEPTGLGRMTFPSRLINEEAQERALTTLARFAHAANSKSAEKIVAVATSAVREAHNGGDLIERVRRELKLRVKVVSAREESRLIYLGARHAGAFGPTPDEARLLIDIGGGSVEFIVGTNERAMMLESRKLGASRMTAKFIQNDPPTKQEIENLRAHYQQELAPILDQVAIARPSHLIGTSGTLENVAAMLADGDTSVKVIEKKKLDKLVTSLLKKTSAERAEVPGLDDGRKDQIIAGTIMVQELLAGLAKIPNSELRTMELCDGALREGILIDYVERKLPQMRVRREVPEPRRRSVLDLCRRCDWHKDHSEQVTALTLRLFDHLKPQHQLGPLDRELLEYAGLMHDIGWHIGRKKHHKHSAYLIRHGRLRNFSEEEIEIMACIARYHRKAHPSKNHADYVALPARARKTVDYGAALLRVADGLDRTHAAVIRDVRTSVNKRTITLHLETAADAELEIWGAKRKADWMEELFGRKVEFKVDG